MEISSKVPSLKNTPYVKQSSKPQEKTLASPTSGTKNDRVKLSPKAQELQAARDAIGKMDDVDNEKVAAVKAQIQAGTYKVDSQKIAAKMLEESF